MDHTAKPEKIKPCRRTRGYASRAAPIAALLVLTLAGCAGHRGPLAMFRGMIAKPPPPAPGLDAPFPNLASVPAKPKSLSTADQRQIRAQLEAANQAARAELLPRQPAPAAVPLTVRHAAPLLIGFAPGSAIIQRKQQALLRSLVQQRGNAPAVLAAGFAPAANAAGLRLALHRALAIANQLTDAGLPPADIRLAALTSGHGGFAQLLYDSALPPKHAPAQNHPNNHPNNHPQDRLKDRT